MNDVEGTIYLIHFERRYKHAAHYMGWTEDLDARIERHRRGAGARLMEVVTRAGIGWSVVRTWQNVTRHEERRMKGRSLAYLCPVCKEEKKKRAKCSEAKSAA